MTADWGLGSVLDDRTKDDLDQLPVPKDFIVYCKRQERKCEVIWTVIKVSAPQAVDS